LNNPQPKPPPTSHLGSGQGVEPGGLGASQPLVEADLNSLHGFASPKLPIPHIINQTTHETLAFIFRRIGEFEPAFTLEPSHPHRQLPIRQ